MYNRLVALCLIMVIIFVGLLIWLSWDLTSPSQSKLENIDFVTIEGDSDSALFR